MKTRKRIPATLLAIATAFSLVGYVPAYAAEHIHDETCGYSEGSPCTHTIHDETCGYAEAANLPCKHELGQHDETCGYVAATPCTDQASPAELGTLTASGANVEELISEAVCTVSSEDANTEAAVKAWLKDTWLPGIDRLEAALQSEFYIEEINALTVITDTSSSSPPPFVEAKDGTSESPYGEDGHYSFIICMGSGSSVTTLGRNTCIITAKAYTPPSSEKLAPEIVALEEIPSETGVVTAAKGSTVTLRAALSSNAAKHTLQWQKKSPGDADFMNIADATRDLLEIKLNDNYVDHTQYRCAAVYEDGSSYPSNVLTIQAEEEAAYTVSINEDEGEGFLLKADRTSVKLVAVIKDAVTGAPFIAGVTTKYTWTLTGTDSAYFSADATNQANMTVTVKDGTKGTHNVTVGLTVTIGGIEIPASSIVITRQEADKSDLQSKVNEATNHIAATVIDTDGSNVEIGKYWIPEELSLSGTRRKAK